MCAFVPRSADLIFRQLPIKMFHLLVGGVSALCVCVCSVFANGFQLSRCSIFRQFPIKMFHLSVGGVSALCVCYVFVNGFHAVKMFHLSAASHQDVPSFGGGSQCIVCVLRVREWLPCCQDVPSFGSFPSRCSIFRWGESVHCVCVMCL